MGETVLPYAAPSASARPRLPRRFVASLSFSGTIGPAPARVRLWNPGINPWDGEVPINLTRAAAERVIAEFNRRGNPLSMDIDHAQSVAEQRAKAAGALETPEQTVGAGYCALELVETPDGPAIDFLPRWSDCGRPAPVPEVVCCAKHQIESGQRGEFSPDWLGDEQTGEPIRINRISLVQDGAMHRIGLMASRHRASEGSMGEGKSEMDGCRAAYAYHAKMAAAGGEDAKDHETMAAKLKANAAAIGVDLEKSEGLPGEPAPAMPAGDKPRESAATEPPPPAAAPPKPPGEEPPKPKPEAASVATLASRTQAQPLTMADVLKQFAEQKALDTLIASNADRIPAKHQQMLASQGLAATRAYVEGLPLRPAPAGTSGDVAGALGNGAQRRHRASLTAGEQFLASRVHAALDKSEESATAFDKRPEVYFDDQGRAAYEFSLVAVAKRKAEERRALPRRV